MYSYYSKLKKIFLYNTLTELNKSFVHILRYVLHKFLELQLNPGGEFPIVNLFIEVIYLQIRYYLLEYFARLSIAIGK